MRVSAKKLLDHLHDKLVQDWRRKVDVMNDVDSTIRRVLDQELPERPYTLNVFTSKVRLIFDHVLTAHGDNGQSAYTARGDSQPSVQSSDYIRPLDVNKIADDVVARIHDDPVFAAHVAAQLGASPSVSHRSNSGGKIV